MKRLLSIVILLGIIAYITVQVIKDRRYNALSNYDFPISQDIDTDFYDRTVVKEYYRLALEVGTFARSVWRTDMYDVRQPKQGDREESLQVVYYNELRQNALLLQAKLEASKELKGQGRTNPEIKLIMEEGWTPADFALKEKSHLIGLQRGSNGSNVWELQKLLNAKGDSIPEDGIFNLITTNRLKEFQSNNDLFPSGEVDKNTLSALLK